MENLFLNLNFLKTISQKENLFEIINNNSIKLKYNNKITNYDNIFKDNNNDYKLFFDLYLKEDNLIYLNYNNPNNIDFKNHFYCKILNELFILNNNNEEYFYDIYLSYFKIENDDIIDLLVNNNNYKIYNYKKLKEILLIDFKNSIKYWSKGENNLNKNSIKIWRLNIKKYNNLTNNIDKDLNIKNYNIFLIDFNYKNDNNWIELNNLINNNKSINNIRNNFLINIFKKINDNKKIIINFNINNNDKNTKELKNIIKLSENIRLINNKELKNNSSIKVKKNAKDEIKNLKKVFEYKFQYLNNKINLDKVEINKLKKKNFDLKYNLKLKKILNNKSGILFYDDDKKLEKTNKIIINSGLITINLYEIKIQKLESLLDKYLNIIENLLKININNSNINNIIDKLNFDELNKLRNKLDKKWIKSYKISKNNQNNNNDINLDKNKILFKNLKKEKTMLNKLVNDKNIKFYQKYFLFNINSFIDHENLKIIKNDYNKIITNLKSILTVNNKIKNDSGAQQINFNINYIKNKWNNNTKINSNIKKNKNKVKNNFFLYNSEINNLKNIYTKNNNNNNSRINKNSIKSKEKYNINNFFKFQFKSNINKIFKEYNLKDNGKKKIKKIRKNSKNNHSVKKKSFITDNLNYKPSKKKETLNLIENYLNDNQLNDINNLIHNPIIGSNNSIFQNSNKINLKENNKIKKINWNLNLFNKS